jgi:hypothetical protein
MTIIQSIPHLRQIESINRFKKNHIFMTNDDIKRYNDGKNKKLTDYKIENPLKDIEVKNDKNRS